MKLLCNAHMRILAGAIVLATACAATAQSNQQNSQQSNGSNGNTTPSSGSTLPYNPPTPPPGGYGNAQTGSYSGKGSAGYGDGTSPSSGSQSYGVQNGIPSSIGQIGKNGQLADDTPENQQQMEMRQARARNDERQRQLVSDTQKLVTLANELQNEVNRSTKDMLSLDVVRKADEIDKLARNVRDKMKNAN